MQEWNTIFVDHSFQIVGIHCFTHGDFDNVLCLKCLHYCKEETDPCPTTAQGRPQVHHVDGE